MFHVLDKTEKEEVQRKGYMFEHLLCLYSMFSDRTVLYNDSFPVFFNNYGEADLILFGLREGEDKSKCIKELTKLPIKILNIVTPISIQNVPNIKTRFVDWDFHINVKRFDFELKGKQYHNIRNKLRKAEKIGYNIKINREFTSDHFHILSRHMANHKLDVWDYEELLSLELFFRNHNHGFMMEAYKDNVLIGFDVIDFFEDNGIMVVPLGIYLDFPYLSDYMMHENLKFAREKGYNWIDVGLSCRNPGLRRFKEKWFAKPKYKLHTQILNLK